MSRTLVITASLIFSSSCKKEPDLGPPAEIVDLSTNAGALYSAFDAHSEEARFLTLLSPA